VIILGLLYLRFGLLAIDRDGVFDFRVAYVVVNSNWLAPQHFVPRVRAIQASWATQIRLKDSITYAVDAKYYSGIPRASSGGEILELPADMANHAMLYTLGHMLSNGNSDVSPRGNSPTGGGSGADVLETPFDWVYIAADASYVIPQNVEVLIDRLQRENASQAYYLGVPLLLPIEGYGSFFGFGFGF
jgi:hypothetical protein